VRTSGLLMEWMVRNIMSSAIRNRKFGRLSVVSLTGCIASAVCRLARATEVLIPKKVRRFKVLLFSLPFGKSYEYVTANGHNAAV